MEGKILIPKPCHENWNKMTLEEKGRHCAVCSKVVTDFTRMQKEEILTTLKESKDEICGHINMSQLTPANKRQKFYFWFKGSFIPKVGYAAFAIFGLASIFKKSAFAQVIDHQMINGGARYEPQTTENKRINIEVVDERNHPVTNALVTIRINDEVVNSVNTNDKGETGLLVETQISGNTYIDVEVNAPGYVRKVVRQVRILKAGQTIRIKMDEEIIILGKMIKYEEPLIKDSEILVPEREEEDIIITENPSAILINPTPNILVSEEVEHLDQTQPENIDIFIPRFGIDKNLLSFISFPNPTIGDITIETKEEVSFDVRIYNELGVEILQEMNQYKRLAISLAGHPAGTYFAMLFINNKAVETHKIILVK